MNALEFLDRQGVDFEVKHHDEYFTAQEEAAAQPLPGAMFAKTVVVKTQEDFVLLVLPASYRVDLDLVSDMLGEEVELAQERDLKELFPACELGAEPPFGSHYGLRTLVDEHLAKQQRIAVRACTHKEVILLAYEDFARIEKPRVVRLARAEV
jgi:Ala-tRNA(Pro) deacylase